MTLNNTLARFCYLLLGLVMGGAIVGTLYSKKFDPDGYWELSKILAAESAMRACVTVRKDRELCRKIALDIYYDLDTIEVKNR